MSEEEKKNVPPLSESEKNAMRDWLIRNEKRLWGSKVRRTTAAVAQYIREANIPEDRHAAHTPHALRKQARACCRFWGRKDWSGDRPSRQEALTATDWEKLQLAIRRLFTDPAQYYGLAIADVTGSDVTPDFLIRILRLRAHVKASRATLANCSVWKQYTTLRPEMVTTQVDSAEDQADDTEGA